MSMDKEAFETIERGYLQALQAYIEYRAKLREAGLWTPAMEAAHVKRRVGISRGLRVFEKLEGMEDMER